MSGSLKLLLRQIAQVLDVPETTLYERQRALVREGLLESVPGHGRGSGVRAGPESLAVLVIGMLATSTWSETGSAARALADAVPPDILGHRSVGKRTFRDELTRILSNENLASKVDEILLQASGWAIIVSTEDISSEGPFMVGPPKNSGLQRESKVTGDAVRALAKLVAS